MRPDHFAMDNVDDEGFDAQEGAHTLVGGMKNMLTPVLTCTGIKISKQ